jgi:hypothetical protein
MSRVLRAVDGYWLAPGSALRLATLRLLVGAFTVVYLLVRAPVLADFSRLSVTRFEPAGIAQVLRTPLPAALTWLLFGLCVLSALAFALGYRFRVTGPACAALLLWVTSYRNSWGMVFHTDNLLVLHALVLGLSPAADALSLDARARVLPGDDARYGWPVRLLCAVAVATYVLAGIAKLKASGLHWAEGEILRNYIAYDGMRKAAIGSLHSPLGASLVQHAWPFPILGALTLALELGAPVAMLGGRAASLWVAGVWAFHVGVLLTMAIAFPYPLSGVGLAAFLPCEQLWRWGWLRPLAARIGVPVAQPQPRS